MVSPKFMETEKVKKQRNYSQLEEQEKSPERTNNETDLTSLLDPESKNEVIKMLI